MEFGLEFVTCDYSKSMSLHSVVPMWWMLKFLKWNGGSITHNPLHMCMTTGIYVVYIDHK
jgi:hypothetical protein